MITKFTMFSLILILLFSLSCTLESSIKDENQITVDTKNSREESEDLVKTLVEELMKLPNTPPGMSVAISDNNKIIFSEGFGYSNLKTKERINPKTQFRAGSLSRIITITALAKLVEEGKLAFEDLIQQHIPNYPKKEYVFSIKQLASGLAGMAHYSDKDRLEDKNYNSIEDALGVFSHVPLMHKPGDKYQYSIHAYTLLSRVIEKASNKELINLLHDKVFEPLSMLSSGAEIPGQPTEDMTELYHLQRDGINKDLPTKMKSPKNYSYSLAGAGLVSTPSDLVKLANSYTSGFIRKDIADKIFEIQKLNSGEKTRVGIAWDQNWDMANRKVYEQDGAGDGTRSIVSLFPNDKLAISIMANALRVWAIEETAHVLALPFLTDPSPIKQPKGLFELNIAQDSRGKWVEKNGTLILDGENDRIIIKPNTKDEEIYKLIYLNRDNIYALIHPDGILYTEINLKNKILSGKVMYYRGPNIHKTSEEPPYLKFKSKKRP